MKKLVLVLSIIAMVAFVGCSKEKTCKCVAKTDGVYTSESTSIIPNGDCSDLDSETSSYGYTVTVTCNEE